MLEIVHGLARLNLSGALHAVTQGEFFLLSIVRRLDDHTENRTNPVNVSRLAVALEVTSASVSRMLRGLESRGYLDRVTDPENRRNTCVRLTEKGSSLFLKENELVQKLAERVFSRIGEENMRTLLKLSEQLHGVLEEELQPLSDSTAPALPERYNGNSKQKVVIEYDS